VGRSCIDNVFTNKQTIEKKKRIQPRNSHNFPGSRNKRGIPYHLTEVIKGLYKNTSVRIDTGRKILDKMHINQGVRQGCNLSPALFNIYIDGFLRNWKHKADAGIMFKRNLYLNTLLFADDQVIIQDSEGKLQKSLYILHQMSKDYNLKISTDKTKIMAFKGKHLVRSKIEIERSILEQVREFIYLFGMRTEFRR
jgi:hypothetical protein